MQNINLSKKDLADSKEDDGGSDVHRVDALPGAKLKLLNIQELYPSSVSSRISSSNSSPSSCSSTLTSSPGLTSTSSSSSLLSKSLLPSPFSPYPGPTYQLQQGDLKKAFLGRLPSSTLDLQLVTCPKPRSRLEMKSGLVSKMVALSDSRDSTTSWRVMGKLLEGLVMRGLQPVIRVTAFMVDQHKLTLNIVTYEVIDNTEKVLGKPMPIKQCFFDYMRNRNLDKTPSTLVSLVSPDLVSLAFPNLVSLAFPDLVSRDR